MKRMAYIYRRSLIYSIFKGSKYKDTKIGLDNDISLS